MLNKINKRLTFILVLFCIYLDDKCKAKIYKTVGNFVLNAEDLVKKNSLNFIVNNKNLAESSRNMACELNDMEKKRIFFELGTFKGGFRNEFPILKPHSLFELNLLTGFEESKHVNLYENIDRTTTSIGSAVLAIMLSCPLSDTQALLRRQKLVKLLFNDEKLFNQLNNLIITIKGIENSILNYWNASAELAQATEKLFYEPKNSPFEYLNKSSIYHQFSYVCSLARLGITALMIPGTPLVFIPLILNSDKIKAKLNKDTDYIYWAWSKGILTSLAFEGILYFYTKPLFENYKIKKLVLNGLHKRIIDLSTFINAIKEMNFLIATRKEIFEILDFHYKSQNFIKEPEKLSKGLVALQNLLENFKTDKKSNLFSYVGDVLAAYDYMREVKNNFFILLESYGEIDAYLSIVKLLKEHQDRTLGFCFVDFVGDEKPFVDLKEIWNPLISGNSAEPIDITLGNANSNNILLSGPHGGGKSSFMRSVAYAVALGQSFAIAPAKKARMTSFNKILSFVNTTENIGAGFSNFMSEKFRIEEILKDLAELDNGQKALVIIDEPFKGTMEDEGSMRAYAAGLKIAKFSNTACLMATHFKKLVNLETETGNFKNYHFEITETDNNKFVRNYKLLPGSCDWWYYDPDKRKRYIDFALIS